MVRECAFHGFSHCVQVQAKVFGERQERRDTAAVAQAQFARLTNLTQVFAHLFNVVGV